MSKSISRRSLPVLPEAGEPVRTAEDAPERIVPLPSASGVGADGLRGPRIKLLTLGCDKNTVDSERTLSRLIGAGARLTGDVADAEVVVINTCGFIDVAREESIDTILGAVRLKEEGEIRAVVAMGCLVQRYEEQLTAEIPEVDLFLGLTEADRLVPELRARGALPVPDAVPTMERPLRVLSTRTPHTSHLKVSEGCDHSCAFCAIPTMRGKHRSTPIDRLVREAGELDRQGVVELNLISQDTTWYGRDILRGTEAAADEDFFIGKPFDGMAGRPPRPVSSAGGGSPGRSERGSGRAEGGRAGHGRRASRAPDGGPTAGAMRQVSPHRRADGKRPRNLLPELLSALLDETDIPWFRLFYMYPSGIDRTLVERIAAEERIVPYLDMPIQHGADPVLERMRRPERQATIRERVGWLRDAIPELALRTTIIVGFPGETEADFEAMLELLEEICFDHLGAFPYSPEQGTRAVAMSGQVPEAVTRERLERLHDLQRSITFEKNATKVGRTLRVLVDRSAEEHAGDVPAGVDAVGRWQGQALDLDGVVYLRGAADARPGDFVQAAITEAQEYDLMGQVCGVDASCG